MDWVDKPQNYKDLYGILQLLRFSHLNNFQLKTLKLGWVAFHSVTFQLKCLDFQSNQYKKLVPVLSRFCNGLWARTSLIFDIGLIPKIVPLKLFLVPSSSGDATPAMRGQPTRLSRTTRGEMAGNLAKTHLYVLIFKRRFVAEMFSTLRAVVLFGWAFV